jgi:hypothetical protein
MIPSQRVSSPISAQHLNAPVFVPKAPPFQPTTFALPHQGDLIPQYELDPHTATLQIDNIGIGQLVRPLIILVYPIPHVGICRASVASRPHTHTTTRVLPPILAHLQIITSTTGHPSRFPSRNSPTIFSLCAIPFGKSSNVERRIFGHRPLSLCPHRRKYMSITH